MRDIELLVRFYAFKNFASGYNGNLKDFLDNAVKTINSEWKSKQSTIQKQAVQFEEAIDVAFQIFEGDPFRKWDGDKYESRFNRAIFDVIVYFFSDEKIRKLATTRQAAVLLAFKKLCTKNTAFVRSVETTTKSKGATSTRFNHWAEALGGAIGMPLTPPKIYE
jgi:hypothetical protein